jgi:hypothetical protein
MIGNKREPQNMTTINITISVELTQLRIIRAGVITDEARALELARELHEIIAQCVELYRAEKIRPVKFLDDDPDAEPVELEPLRPTNALEIADFTLALWRCALTSDDGDEACWANETLSGITPLNDDKELYLRWMMISDIVTGADIGSLFGAAAH